MVLQSNLVWCQKLGCTDVMAKNFNGHATINDGSCRYKKAKVKPQKSVNLAQPVTESSGLLIYHDILWTHNDDQDSAIYGYILDSIQNTKARKIEHTKHIALVKTSDWEAITQDADFIYLGDFGNNAHGNRTDLQIKKLSKKGLETNAFTTESIFFTYPNQTDWSKQKSERTNFDCEAMVSIDSTLYLFTKQWLTNQTTVYKLRNQPGTQQANMLESFKIKGLVTDAAYVKKYHLLVLCGYTKLLKPFVYLFYDFEGDAFFSGNKRKIKLKLPWHQIEGIATTDGLQYYLTNEEFNLFKPVIHVPPKLHILDLSPFLSRYISAYK